METIFFIILFIICGIIAYKLHDKFKEINISENDYGEETDVNAIPRLVTLIAPIICLILSCLIFMFSTIYTVDAGEAVILIQFGEPYDQVSDPGIHFKRPWADTIEWITRLKALDENLEARSKDDMKITVDLTTWWAVQCNKLDILYSKISKDYETLESGFVIPAIRSAIRDEIAKSTYNELNTNREKYADSISKYVAAKLSDKYVIVDKVNIRNIIPPKTVNDSIESKLKMEQDVQREAHKVELAKKQAEVRRIEAKGIADSQKIIQQKLTPLYVQWYAIEMQKELAGSPNTTFYFVPMSNNSGIPMVYGMPKEK